MQLRNHSERYAVRLVAIPALLSLAITALRLAGEMLHWSDRWFSTATGGFVPGSSTSWLVGITWLPIPLGAYFALRLTKMGKYPPHGAPRATLLALLGVAFLIGSQFLIPRIGFPRVLIFIWLYMVLAALLQYPAWPALFKTLLYYGAAARIPVVVVMFLAMLNNWGTHYDYVGMPPQFSMSLLPRFLWLAFFPQLIFWVGFTILAGSLTGSVTAWLAGAAVRRKEP